MGWFEATQHCDKNGMTIANLVETVWLTTKQFLFCAGRNKNSYSIENSKIYVVKWHHTDIIHPGLGQT